MGKLKELDLLAIFYLHQLSFLADSELILLSFKLRCFQQLKSFLASLCLIKSFHFLTLFKVSMNGLDDGEDTVVWMKCEIGVRNYAVLLHERLYIGRLEVILML